MNTRNDIRTTQEQRLQQRLVPQQVRYVKLLEMTGPEIEDEVRRELDENPALENVSSSVSSENDAHSDDLPTYRYYANNHSADDSHFDHIAVNAGETLQEAMLRQLADLTLTSRQRTIASYIIGNIDNNGYLTRHINLIASDIGVKEGIDVDDDEMRGMFNVVRGLDPAGAGAVDLRDCLLLQLRRRDSADTNTRLATIMVSDYFDLFSKRHFDRLRMALDITPEQMTEIQGIIRSLNPKPGSTFNSEGSTPASHTV
ncbi:MAG: hypothetical protein K2M76_03400, partial [Muribaculaceae bacterium]|nr:hypothetical protein [Muribaculaceae bacterium]